MKYRVFISSVQSEFAAERRGLKEYLQTDALLREYVEEVFLFEDVPSARRTPNEVYMDAVNNCDVFIGLYGCQFGYVFADGTSPTEREYHAAYGVKTGKKTGAKTCKKIGATGRMKTSDAIIELSSESCPPSDSGFQ